MKMGWMTADLSGWWTGALGSFLQVWQGGIKTPALQNPSCRCLRWASWAPTSCLWSAPVLPAPVSGLQKTETESWNTPLLTLTQVTDWLQKGRRESSVLRRYLVLHPSAAARTPEETPSHPAHSPGRRFSRWPGLNGPQSPRETRLLPCTYGGGWGAQPLKPSDLNSTSTVSYIQPKCPVLFWPFSSLQVIVGLFKLSDVFVELLLDAASLSQVVLQHRNLFVALGVLLLQLLLNKTRREKSSGVSVRNKDVKQT